MMAHLSIYLHKCDLCLWLFNYSHVGIFQAIDVYFPNQKDGSSQSVSYQSVSNITSFLTSSRSFLVYKERNMIISMVWLKRRRVKIYVSLFSSHSFGSLANHFSILPFFPLLPPIISVLIGMGKLVSSRIRTLRDMIF